MDNQLAILKEAKRRGIDPTVPMRDEDYQLCALAIRTRAQIVVDGTKMLASRFVTDVIHLEVLPEKAAANAEVCKTSGCGKNRILLSGKDACDVCNCNREGLDSWRKNPIGFCPMGYWSNRATADRR